MRCSEVRRTASGPGRRSVVLVVRPGPRSPGCSPPARRPRPSPCSRGTSTPTPVARTRWPSGAAPSQYTISTQVLPTDAGQQRIQLARRLAARRLEHRPDEHRPAVHRGVRQRRLPRPDPRRPRLDARRAVLPERGRRGDLEGQAGRGAVLVQHPGAVVPQVLRREGRHRHDPAGHLGPDHQGRRRQRRHRRRCRPTSTRATSCGSTPSSRAPAGTLVEDADKGVDATISHRLAGRRRRRHGHRGAGPLQGRPAGPLGVQRGHGRLDLRRSPTGAFMVNWTYIFHNYDADAPTSPRTSATRRYPETVAGEPSRPPYGGIGIGVSEYSDHKDLAGHRGAACLTSPDEPGRQRRDHRQHAGQRRRLPVPAAAEALPRRPPGAVPGERRRGRARGRSRRTGATSPARSRAPGTRRPA